MAILAIVLAIGTVPTGLAQTIVPNRKPQCDEACCANPVAMKLCCCPGEEDPDTVSLPKGRDQTGCQCSVRSGSDHDSAVLPAAPAPSPTEMILAKPVLPEFQASSPRHEPTHLCVPRIRAPDFPYPAPRAPPVR